MPVGKFNGTPAFRSGAQSNSNQEIITNDLNQARGTAYDTEDGTAVNAENYAYGQSITSGFDAVQRFQNQFFPDSMYQWLVRWEIILAINSVPNATIQERQEIIALYFKKWSMPPTMANITYFVEQLLGSIFIGFFLYDSMQAGIGFIPGGYSIPGGATLLAGSWSTLVNTINIIIWQPQDKYGNKLMEDSKFNATYSNFYTFLATYLPAYVSFSTIQYTNLGTDSVYGFLNDNKLYGVGTNFTDLIIDSIFIINDNGNPQILKVKSVDSDIQLTLQNSLIISVTDSIWYSNHAAVSGFFLDVPNNLDNLLFTH